MTVEEGASPPKKRVTICNDTLDMKCIFDETESLHLVSESLLEVMSSLSFEKQLALKRHIEGIHTLVNESASTLKLQK